MRCIECLNTKNIATLHTLRGFLDCTTGICFTSKYWRNIISTGLVLFTYKKGVDRKCRQHVLLLPCQFSIFYYFLPGHSTSAVILQQMTMTVASVHMVSFEDPKLPIGAFCLSCADKKAVRSRPSRFDRPRSLAMDLEQNLRTFNRKP